MLSYKIIIKIKEMNIMNPSSEIFELLSSTGKFILKIKREDLEDQFSEIYEKYLKVEEAYILKFKRRSDVLHIALTKNELNLLKKLTDTDISWINDIEKQIAKWFVIKKYNPNSEYWKTADIKKEKPLSYLENNYSMKKWKESELFSKDLYKYIRSKNVQGL